MNVYRITSVGLVAIGEADSRCAALALCEADRAEFQSEHDAGHPWTSDYICAGDCIPTSYRLDVAPACANAYGNVDIRQGIPEGWRHCRGAWDWERVQAIEALTGFEYIPARPAMRDGRTFTIAAHWEPVFDGFLVRPWADNSLIEF